MMHVEDLYEFGYIKTSLDKVFDRRSSVPYEYLMDWLKDSYDYQRSHSEEEGKKPKGKNHLMAFRD